jgi:hypothetical protein
MGASLTEIGRSLLEKRDDVTRVAGGFCYILGGMSPPAMPQDPRRKLEMLLASRFALIVIESREEAAGVDSPW